MPVRTSQAARALSPPGQPVPLADLTSGRASASRPPLWSAIAIGILTGLALVVSCLVLVSRNLPSTTERIRQQLEQNAVLLERVGQVRDFRINGPAAEEEVDDDLWIYEVEGTKGNGRLTVKHQTAEDGSERILWARMQLPSGEVVDLDVAEIETE